MCVFLCIAVQKVKKIKIPGRIYYTIITWESKDKILSGTSFSVYTQEYHKTLS